MLPELSGFRYTRSRTQFRKTENPFSDDLIINVTSRSGASYSIAFYIGVAHSEAEALVANLEGRKVSPYDRTILQYSPNVLKQAVIPFDGSCGGGVCRQVGISLQSVPTFIDL